MSPASLDAASPKQSSASDTLWGGDVMNPSGVGRFIADCWFSDEPLPSAYTHRWPTRCARTAASGRKRRITLRSKPICRWWTSMARLRACSPARRAVGGLRGAYLEGLGLCCEVMWDLAMEIAGRGPPVPYERCVRTITGRAPEPSQPEAKRRRVAELLATAGHPSNGVASLLAAVDAWRAARRVPPKSIAAVGDAFVAHYDALSARHLMPHLPPALARVPRANVRFLAIENAWFSGSMNYLGHARRADGSPELRGDLRVERRARDLGAGVPAIGEPRSSCRVM